MILENITIKNYKSIKEPINIDIQNNKFFTFIGKNGSGKTNLLQALKYSLTKNNYHTGNKENVEAEYKFKITDKEKEMYFKFIDSESFIEQNKNEVLINFSGAEPNIREIDAPILEVSISDFKNRLNLSFEKYKKSSSNYIEKLKLVECSYNNDSYIIFDAKKTKGSIYELYNNRIENIKDLIQQNIEEFDKNMKIFKEETIKIDINYFTSYYINLNIHEIPRLEIITDRKLLLSPIIAKSLGLKKDDVDKANKKINRNLKTLNKNLKTEFNEMESAVIEFNSIIKDIKNIFDNESEKLYNKEELIEERYNAFYSILKQNAFNTGYYIDNEYCLLFNDSEYNDYSYKQKRNEYLGIHNPIFESIDNYLRENNFYTNKDDSLLKPESIDESEYSKIEKIINEKFFSDIPEFDRKMVEKYFVKFTDKRLQLFVREKTGEEINFNHTSLGRRWYFTYYFVKKLLKHGDFLFIDEPATFLHPEAQSELKKDLQTLSENGIYVFITTHSPYMIPEKWNSIYNVEMTENGTIAKSFSTKDETAEQIKSSLGLYEKSNILFNLSKTILLVEGDADKTCIEKFANILEYNLDDYSIMVCNGHPIIDIAYLCIEQNIKFKALFDYDNKEKPESFMKNKHGYKEYLEKIINNENCIFTPENGEQKSLEDCFSKEDHEKYFFKLVEKPKTITEKVKFKIDKSKVNDGNDFTKETKEQFEQLFTQLKLPKIDK